MAMNGTVEVTDYGGNTQAAPTVNSGVTVTPFYDTILPKRNGSSSPEPERLDRSTTTPAIKGRPSPTVRAYRTGMNSSSPTIRASSINRRPFFPSTSNMVVRTFSDDGTFQ